jgi:phenylalanyl-tRNA synthetase beta chain
MKASLRWLSAYLNPSALSVEDAEKALTFAGLPIDSFESLDTPEGPDSRMEVEVTSNRGDCLCHIGLAREIAAVTGRQLVGLSPGITAASHTGGLAIASELSGYTLDNQLATTIGSKKAPCPRFTLRLIKGLKVGPSPAWMRQRLEAIGQRSINNIVDCTNYVLHELGIPSHVFDAQTISGKRLTIRHAEKGEKLDLLDGTSITTVGPITAGGQNLPGEMVICDAQGPASLAGVMGGQRTSVSDRTVDILLEVATWDPVLVRMTSRRHNKRSDSSYRYERYVDARSLDVGLARLIELIVQTAGNSTTKVHEGLLDQHAPMPPVRQIELRPLRVNRVLGRPIALSDITRTLETQGFTIAPFTASDATLHVTAPSHRHDVSLEIDLIEEIARTLGYDHLPVSEKLAARVSGLQGTERARRELARTLTGQGFYEAVTFSFINSKIAKPFLAPDRQFVAVSEDRRGEENICRPSIIPGLLACRKANQDAQISAPGGIRLFEESLVFDQDDKQLARQPRMLGLLIDVPADGSLIERRQKAVSLLRGALEQIVLSLAGANAKLIVEPFTAPGKPLAAYDPAATGTIKLITGDDRGTLHLGTLGILTQAVQAASELQNPVAAAEILIDPLLASFPPRAKVTDIATFPPTQRDLSLIVSESRSFATLESIIREHNLAMLESLTHVTTYRGKPLEVGQKSITLRMTFRAHDRTLRDEEVNSQVQSLIETLKTKTGATIRTA